MPKQSAIADYYAMYIRERERVAELEAALRDIVDGVSACDRCGVTYSDFTGRCREPAGAREPYHPCNGIVGPAGRAEHALKGQQHD